MSDDLTSPAKPRQSELDALLRALLKRAIHFSRLSREQLADELTKRLERTISPATVDAWTADAKIAWRLPADAVPTVCEILQDDAIQRQLLSPEQRDALELGESATRLRSLLCKALSRANQPRRKAPQGSKRLSKRRQ